MWRSLLILLGLLALTWFEFQVYPGHTYLFGETQLLVPMLERMDTPGFLSRDLVAANPTFAYTIYDEITEQLHVEVHLTFEKALQDQQLLFRFAAVLGIFLLARALHAEAWAALVVSGLVNAVTALTAPHAWLTNPEPTPVAFALSLVLLAAGLLAHGKPLLASLAAGLALLYDPMTAAPFWLLLIVIFIFDRSLRRMLRPVWPILLIFALLLGNIIQLQSGLGSSDALTSHMDADIIHLTQIRTPWTWVSHWIGHEIWSYLFLFVAAAAAFTFIPRTDRITRWVFIGLASGGFLSAVCALFLLARQSQIAVAMPPARNLASTVALSLLVCGAALFQAVKTRQWRVSAFFAAPLLAALINPQVLDLLHRQTALSPRPNTSESVATLAAWAEQNTWGSSMFQFADTLKQPAPAIFRALSKRPLWADWQSGEIADYSSEAGLAWWSRWQSCMAKPFSAATLQAMLPLPIDYYVLHRDHKLVGVKAVYSNATYLVYDAQDLRDELSVPSITSIAH
jgi:hypothetical protein